MVGDHPEKDILGAKALGIRTARMRRHDSYRQYHDPQPDYYVENMYDVQEQWNKAMAKWKLLHRWNSSNHEQILGMVYVLLAMIIFGSTLL